MRTVARRDAEIAALQAEVSAARSREAELEHRVEAAQYVARECTCRRPLMTLLPPPSLRLRHPLLLCSARRAR